MGELAAVGAVDVHGTQRMPIGRLDVGHHAEAVAEVVAGAEGVNARRGQRRVDRAVVVGAHAERAEHGRDAARLGEGGVALQLVVDLGTVRVTNRQLVGRLPLRADQPAEAVVGAADRHLAVGRTGREPGHAHRGQAGAEVDPVRQGDIGVLVDEADADRETVVQLECSRQGQVDRLHVGSDRVVAADPILLVFGLQAERRADARAHGQPFEAATQRYDDGHRRHRLRAARIAAIAAVDRGAECAGRRTRELGGQVDHGHVDLDRGLVEVGHRRRIVGDHRRVVIGHRGARVGATQVLDAVFTKLEARRLCLTQRERAGDAQDERGHTGEAGDKLHACSLQWSIFGFNNRSRGTGWLMPARG